MKKHTHLYIDEDVIKLAKLYRLNISSICQEALELELRVKGEYLDASVESLKDAAILHLGERERLREERTQIQRKAQGKLNEMIDFIKKAVAAGKYRGEAEVDFGACFPNGLWEKYGGLPGARVYPEWETFNRELSDMS